MTSVVKAESVVNAESVVIPIEEEAKLSDSFFFQSRRKRSITELGLNGLGHHNFAMRQILNAKSAKQLLQQELNYEEVCSLLFHSHYNTVF